MVDVAPLLKTESTNNGDDLIKSLVEWVTYFMENVYDEFDTYVITNVVIPPQWRQTR